jgi:hypothetical protein
MELKGNILDRKELTKWNMKMPERQVAICDCRSYAKILK